MDWSTYKKVCDQPNVLSRWLLQQTSAVCNNETKLRIDEILATMPLEKPEDHKGGAVLDMFETRFPLEIVKEITSHVEAACTSGTQTTGDVVRDYQGILRAWQEYMRLFESS
ncbi:MAG: hypothetical protein OXG24_05870 [Gammaproteobacteria bacterium]|nr:hypothetical protein [Gammaproteobacteria bacterium]